MRKYTLFIITLLVCVLSFSFLTFTHPQICNAAGNLPPNGAFCSTSPDNCQTPAIDPATGKSTNYHCETQFDPMGGGVNVCVPDLNAAPQPGGGQKQCPAKGDKCDLVGTGNTANNGGCCEHDTDGKTPLGCDAKTNTCQPQSQLQCDPKDPSCNACAKENAACGKTANLNCCQQVNGTQTLTCMGANNQPVALSDNGTCKFFDKTQALSPPPPPPSPPCAKWNAGRCDQFASAFGALDTNPEGFVKTIFSVLLSLSGGIALLLIIKAGYQMMTSQGRPEQLQSGRDQLIAAIVGLVFLIFSFVVLEVIGYNILRIPGFGA